MGDRPAQAGGQHRQHEVTWGKMRWTILLRLYSKPIINRLSWEVWLHWKLLSGRRGFCFGKLHSSQNPSCLACESLTQETQWPPCVRDIYKREWSYNGEKTADYSRQFYSDFLLLQAQVAERSNVRTEKHHRLAKCLVYIHGVLQLANCDLPTLSTAHTLWNQRKDVSK